jgi:hypothetical protein
MEVQVARDRELGLESQGIGARGGRTDRVPGHACGGALAAQDPGRPGRLRPAGAHCRLGVCGELHDVCGPPRRLGEHRGTDRRVTAGQWT